MRVGADDKRIIARLEFVALEPVPVRVRPIIRLHIGRFERKLDGIGAAAGNKFRFRERAEHHVRLLDTARRIRRGIVQLHHVFTGGLRFVCDRDGDFDRVVFGDRAAIGFIERDVPIEIRVRKSVTERIHYVRIIPSVGRFRRLVLLEPARFVIPVPDVNAFLVVYERELARTAVGRDISVAELTAVHTRVVPSGVLSKVRRPGIHGMSRRIDRTREHSADRFRTRRTGQAHPQYRVYIGIGFQLAEFHGRSRIEYDDHLIEIRLDMSEQILLVLVEFEIVARRALRARNGGIRTEVRRHCARQVEALAADARKYDDRRVAIVRVRACQSVVTAFRRFARCESRKPLTARHGGVIGTPAARARIIVVKTLERGIVSYPRRREAVVQRDARRTGRAARRTRPAVNEIDGVFAEHAYLGRSSERERAAFIFEQSDAFLGNRYDKVLRRRQHFLFALVFAVVQLVATIVRYFGAFAAEHKPERIVNDRNLRNDE